MTDERTTVNVKIFGREYPFSCPADQVESLEKAARSLNERMNEIQEAGRLSSTERIAVMAALNATHELMALQEKHERYAKSVNEYVQRMQDRLKESLQEDQQLSLPTD
jgi:cell division protein ZapA